MAGLAQVSLQSAVHRIPLHNASKDLVRLVSTSGALNKHNFQYYQTPPSKLKKIASWSTATTAGKQIDSVAASLASKGFLRSQNPYVPPHDVVQRVKEIFSTMKIATDSSLEQCPLKDKFAILEACSTNFNRTVPNSQLHEIKTFDAIVKFYETPVDNITPLDALQRTQLPENLHVQYDYVRFHPETDTMFGGKSAFPKSSTLVTGLKYRNKYQGHIAKRSWP